MPEQQNDKPTAQQDPSQKGWAVLVSKKLALWKEISSLSIILFAVALGATAIIWAAVAGGEFASPLAMFQRYTKDKAETAVEQPVYVEPAARRALDGAPRDAEHPGDYYAVMIDNIVEARPSSGLSQAVLVIEAPVESSITRFQAFFDAADEVERIGPVRSVRPYYVDWAEGIDALLAHVGGSPAALHQLASGEVRDMNEFFNGAAFWRDPSRYAPHSTYTSTALLRKAAAKRFGERTLHPPTAWLFKDDGEHAGATAKAEVPGVETASAATSHDVHIGYAAPAYEVDWTYDPERNDYIRSQGGERQFDGDVELRAKNIAVQFTDAKVLDAVGRRQVRTSGSGKAVVISGGVAAEGSWEAVDGRTRFYGPDGDEVVFFAGTTWIEVVPAGFAVTY